MTGLMAISTKRLSPFSQKEANAADFGLGRFALDEHSFNHVANKHVVTPISELSVVINPGP